MQRTAVVESDTDNDSTMVDVDTELRLLVDASPDKTLKAYQESIKPIHAKQFDRNRGIVDHAGLAAGKHEEPKASAREMRRIAVQIASLEQVR